MKVLCRFRSDQEDCLNMQLPIRNYILSMNWDTKDKIAAKHPRQGGISFEIVG